MTIGVIGYRGKIGSLLVKRADFVPVDIDVLKVENYKTRDFSNIDVFVNCAAISSIAACETDYQRAINVNFKGAMNLGDLLKKPVLYISTEQVFGEQGWFLPNEKREPNPLNSYGYTKLAGEGATINTGGKVIRLSRTVTMEDEDLARNLSDLYAGRSIEVPDFFYRNYTYREFAVTGIEYFARNFVSMPDIVHYASLDNVTYYDLVKMIAKRLGEKFPHIGRRTKFYENPPRPKKSGLVVSLAKKIGFPMYTVEDTVDMLARSING